jgi:hypothetical protein
MGIVKQKNKIPSQITGKKREKKPEDEHNALAD